jgi:hypothetical protein
MARFIMMFSAGFVQNDVRNEFQALWTFPGRNLRDTEGSLPVDDGGEGAR